jgi:hypothetical protein
VGIGMTEVAKALYNFWNSFSIPAYVEDNVPSDAQFPYITYTVAEPDWGNSASIQARVWYKDTSRVGINSKVSDIKQAIGEGKSIKTNTGYVVIYRDINFAQNQPYDDIGQSNIKVVYLNAILQSYTRR